MAKQYTVEVSRMRNNVMFHKQYTGTVAELVQVFSYVLLKGNSWDSKVNRNPKSLSALVNNLNRAAEASTTHYQTEFYNAVEVQA